MECVGGVRWPVSEDKCGFFEVGHESYLCSLFLVFLVS